MASSSPGNASGAGDGQRAVTRVYLTGFMGAGKSTAGRLLAAHLGWTFHDTDDLIEEEQQATVSSLFATRGEAAFRELEHAMVRRLHLRENAVISIGGGAIETPCVRSLMHAPGTSCVVFLNAPLPQLIARCVAQDGGSGRPILKNREDLQVRYDLRLTHYQNAHLTVETASLTPQNVVASIASHLAGQHDGDHGRIRSNDRSPDEA